MSQLKEFAEQRASKIRDLRADEALKAKSRAWFEAASQQRYSYQFDWMGVPIIQFPQDLVALQEVVWASRPDCIIETGVAFGGSLLFYASLLKAMDINGPVVGIDVDFRAHNRERLDQHHLRSHIRLIDGSSTAQTTFDELRRTLGAAQNPLVVLDSNHTYEHVKAELAFYSGLVRKGSYLVVLDTIIDAMPAEFSADRPWGPGNGPHRAVSEFLRDNNRFEVDQNYNDKLLISVAPDGFLRCIANP